MPRSARRMRDGLFGVAVALALGFGATQALASESRVVLQTCSSLGQYPVTSCPANRDCSATCAEHGLLDGGICRNNCCTCAI